VSDSHLYFNAPNTRGEQIARPLLACEPYQLHRGDSLDVLDHLYESLPAGAVDLVIADPPYFIGKAAWDEPRSHHEVFEFHRAWLEGCVRLIAPNGSLWVSATSPSIYPIGTAIQKLGMSIVNSVVWVKTHPSPMRSVRRLVPAHEDIIWAKRSPDSTHHFDQQRMRDLNGGHRAMTSVWPFYPARRWERRHGWHPTQKPEDLVERMVLAASRPGDLILDPFVGSGTTAVAAVRHGRRFIGIDQEPRYLAIAHRRVADELPPTAKTKALASSFVAEAA
jgi:site-specific DNA-methyltransferase (adenine-specific)